MLSSERTIPSKISYFGRERISTEEPTTILGYGGGRAGTRPVGSLVAELIAPTASGGGAGVERVSDPLHGARIDAELGSNTTDRFPGLESGKDSVFKLVGYP